MRYENTYKACHTGSQTLSSSAKSTEEARLKTPSLHRRMAVPVCLV